MRSRVCVIVGAGDATGSALARKFHKEGYLVACARRSANHLDGGVVKELGEGCRGFAVDATVEGDVANLFKRVEEEMGKIAVCIHNVGGTLSRSPVVDTTEQVYRKAWESCGLSAFLVGREAARCLTKGGEGGTIIFTGATASVRGGASFSSFAGGMHARRALAQSMARELGPLGIHVAHVIIDGVIDTGPKIKEMLGDELYKKKTDGTELLSPDAIAHAYWSIVQQHKSAWTFETDLRPYCEKF